MAKRDIIQGKIQGNERGYAFLVPLNGGTEDFFVRHSDLNGAMHGDTVLAETVDGEQGKRTAARVLKIAERGIKELVGTYFNHRSGGYVAPDDKKYFDDVFVPAGKGAGAHGGDKVVVRILSYPKNKNPEGIISSGRIDYEIQLIRSLPLSYQGTYLQA